MAKFWRMIYFIMYMIRLFVHFQNVTNEQQLLFVEHLFGLQKVYFNLTNVDFVFFLLYCDYECNNLIKRSCFVM